MRIIVAPDSYKRSLNTAEAGHIIAEAFRMELPNATVEVFPLADGGEGTVEAVLAGTGGRRVRLTATGPMGTPIPTFYGIIEHPAALPPEHRAAEPVRPMRLAQPTRPARPATRHQSKDCHGQTRRLPPSPTQADSPMAVLETAAVAGLTLVPPARRNPLFMTTYGLGECIRHALDHGIRRFLIGLGGSATNDGGLGMLQALGVGFYDREGNRLPDFKPEPVPSPAPSTDRTWRTVADWIFRINRVDFSTLDPRLHQAEMVVASDVQSPLCGPQGASAVFGPQKGATPEQVRLLDEALAHYADKIEACLGRAFRHAPGAGAAGGLGFALLCIGGRIQSGARLIIHASGLADRLPGAHWLITGEGRTDEQTLLGKLPVTLADMAREHGIRTILLSGSLTGHPDTWEHLYRHFDAVFALPNRPMSLEEAMRDVRPLLFLAARNIARLLAASYRHLF